MRYGGGRRGGTCVNVATVVLCATSREGRAVAIAYSLAYDFEVLDGHEATLTLYRIAGFIPVLVIFSAHYMQKVALMERQVVWWIYRGDVIVESDYDLASVSKVGSRLLILMRTFFGGTMAISLFAGMGLKL